MPTAIGSDEDDMQPIANFQHPSPGTLAIPTCSHGTPNRHHYMTIQVGIGGRACSESHENVAAGPPNL